MPKTSIIIPVYNRPAQIIECLSSLLEQTTAADEIVVVNDGSTDNTLSALEEFKSKHREINLQILSNEKNLGITKSKNRGIAIACGDYLLFTDSDCLADSKWVENISNELDSVEVTSGLVLDPAPRNLSERAFFGGSMIGQHPLQKRLVVENNCAFRKEVLRKNKFDEALNYGGEGNELAWRLEKNGHSFSFAKNALIHHRHPLDLKELLKIAIKTGAGESKYFYKKGIFIGRDVIFMALFLFSLALSPLSKLFCFLALAFALIQLALIIACEIFFKRKSLSQALLGLSHNLLYSLVKTLSMLHTTVRILLGFEPEIVRSKKEYLKR